MKLLDLLPASFEVSVLPVILIHVWTIISIPVSPALPMIAAGLYLGMSMFLVGCEWWDDRRHGWHAIRLLTATCLVAPAIITGILFSK